jgi:hypothetical protein
LPEVVITNDAIDAAIFSSLAAAEGRWRKMAFVIVRVVEAAGKTLPDEEESYERIAQRIESLVQQGYLTAQGNIKDWRSSEVRLPRPN